MSKEKIEEDIREWNKKSIKTTAGNEMRVRGLTCLTLTLGINILLRMEFAVVNSLSKELIMSVDALNKLNALIDMEKQKNSIEKYSFSIDIGTPEALTTECYCTEDSDEEIPD